MVVAGAWCYIPSQVSLGGKRDSIVGLSHFTDMGGLGVIKWKPFLPRGF